MAHIDIYTSIIYSWEGFVLQVYETTFSSFEDAQNHIEAQSNYHSAKILNKRGRVIYYMQPYDDPALHDWYSGYTYYA